MDNRIKRYLLVALLFVVLVGSQVACVDDAPRKSSTKTTVISNNTGGNWRKCDSLTCTYKVKLSGDVKTTFKGGRVSLASAVTLGGTWK